MSPRIVSLLPAATEIVCALKCEAWLVGRSHECDFPASVRSLPVCSHSRIDVGGSSRDIDDCVKQTLRDGLSLFEVDLNRLNEVEPTHILTQAQCEVCAVSLADVEAALVKRIGSRPRVVSLSPNCLNDVFEDIRRVAAVFEVVERGESLISGLKSRLDQLQQRPLDSSGDSHWTAGSSIHERPRVVCLEWIEPLMTAGNWVPELVEMAGGENVLSERDQHSPWLDWSKLVVADPDVLVVMPCGWSIARAREELHWITSRPEWPALNAVRSGRVFIVDGHNYFNRPGPRLIDSVEILSEILHPHRRDFGHHGTGWQSWIGEG